MDAKVTSLIPVFSNWCTHSLRLPVGDPSWAYCITTFKVSSFFKSRLISSTRWPEAGNVTMTALTTKSSSVSGHFLSREKTSQDLERAHLQRRVVSLGHVPL